MTDRRRNGWATSGDLPELLRRTRTALAAASPRAGAPAPSARSARRSCRRRAGRTSPARPGPRGGAKYLWANVSGPCQSHTGLGKRSRHCGMCGTGDVDERGRRRGYVSWSVSGGCSWAAIWSRSRCRSSRLAGAAGNVSSKPRSATSSAQSRSAMSPAAAPPAVRVAQRRGRTSGGRGAGRRPLVLRRCRTRQRGSRRSLDEVSEVGAYASHAPRWSRRRQA